MKSKLLIPAGILAIGFAGCATRPSSPAQSVPSIKPAQEESEKSGLNAEVKNDPNTYQLSTSWNTKKLYLTEQNSANNHYSLESFVRGEDRYLVATNELQNSLPFRLYDAKTTSLVFDNGNKTLSPQTEYSYMPTNVFNTNGQMLCTATLSTNGPYALKAKRNDFSLGIDKLVDGIAIAKTDQKDIEFNIKSVNIGGENYFVPMIEAYSGSSDRLPFYASPTNEARIVVAPDGQIKIINKKYGFYEFRRVSEKDYEAQIKHQTDLIQSFMQPTNTSAPTAGAAKLDN